VLDHLQVLLEQEPVMGGDLAVQRVARVSREADSRSLPKAVSFGHRFARR
jgi:hypothetical protein